MLISVRFAFDFRRIGIPEPQPTSTSWSRYLKTWMKRGRVTSKNGRLLLKKKCSLDSNIKFFKQLWMLKIDIWRQHSFTKWCVQIVPFVVPQCFLVKEIPAFFFGVASKSRKFAKEQKRHRIPFHSFHVDAGISASMGGRPEFRPSVAPWRWITISVVRLALWMKSLWTVPNQNQHRLIIIAGVSQKRKLEISRPLKPKQFLRCEMFFSPYCIVLYRWLQGN